MGQFLKADMKRKLLSVPGVHDVDIELVWEPPWNQSMLSEGAKQQLGIS
jgi:metal-sulfur cluster biosynthetic enzyme